MTNGTLQATVLSVLRTPGIEKINFDLNGLIVTGQRYSRVATLIGNGNIACEVEANLSMPPGQELPAGYVVGARYVPSTNTMLFPRDDYGKSDAYEKSAILHEATHATFDAFAKSQDDRVLGIDDESAGILAQALYLTLCQQSGTGTALHRFSMSINGPGELALKIVEKMIADTGNFDKDRQPYKLKPEQLVRFRQAVAVQRKYIKETLKDGSISDRTGAQTIYDGVVVCFSCWGQTLRPTGQSAGAAMRGGAAPLGSSVGLWGPTLRRTGQNAGAPMQGSTASGGLWIHLRPMEQNTGAPKQGSATSPSQLFPKR